MAREIIFVTSKHITKHHILEYHNDTIKAIDDQKIKVVVTSNIHLLSFDLFDKGFDIIKLFHNNIVYDLKLGKNDWTAKYLRKEHNILKIVMADILN